MKRICLRDSDTLNTGTDDSNYMETRRHWYNELIFDTERFLDMIKSEVACVIYDIHENRKQGVSITKNVTSIVWNTLDTWERKLGIGLRVTSYDRYIAKDMIS